MIKHKRKIQIATFLLSIIFPISAIAQINPAFNPNKLIDDAVFSDSQTFSGPQGIQSFLESKGSILANTSPDFLIKLKEPSVDILKQGLEDPSPSLGRLRTAAELIWDASRQSGINPQVLLVTLEKEQSLITGRKNSTPAQVQRALDNAMGFACPDASGCGNLFPGFYFQLFGNYDSANNRYIGASKSLMKSYSTDGGRGPIIGGSTAKVGQTITIDNTTGGLYNAPPSTLVTLANKATAALYRYTPHVFNGNYNFWKFFQDWFRFPNGTVLGLSGDSKTYIIQNGSRMLLPEFVAKARNLSISNRITATQAEFDSYPQDKVFGPADNTIVKVGDNPQPYVFLNNKARPASEFVLKQRSLNPNIFLSINTDEFALFESANVLPPLDGTVIKGEAGSAIYLVDQGLLKLYSAFTFKQRKVAAKNLVKVADIEVASYEKKGFVAPLDTTLVKATNDSAVYYIEQGLKHPITAELFKNRGFSYKNVVSLSPDEVAGLAEGAFVVPKDKTWFAVGNKAGELFYFKEGTKHPVTSFVKAQRKITPDYVFSSAEAAGWADGVPLAPKDGTIIKGDQNPTIYLVSKSQLRPLSEKAFKNRKIKQKQISVQPQAEVDAYAKGETLVK